MSHIVEKWKEFCDWQQRPYQVAEKSAEHHCCRTCGEEYQGNYCPRCGQSAKIGRYSFKNALLLFLDVWGMGNRGMFRTLRDLILRPGYMIRDYISGMQMAYFPPFKLLFLMGALFLVVQSGANLSGINYLEKQEAERVAKKADSDAGEKRDLVKEEPRDMDFNGMDFLLSKYHEFEKNYPNLFSLLWLFAISLFIYLFVRKSPNIPDLRFSELIVAMVYTYDMILIYDIVIGFLDLPGDVFYVAYLTPLIPLKQLTGFKWWRTLLVVFLSYFLVVAIIAGSLLIGYFVLN